MINPRLDKYINDEKYLIYKKDLRYKGGCFRIYYFVIKDNKIIDIIIHRMIDNFIDEGRLSIQNIELEVYKVVKCENGKYYSFRIKDKNEYILGCTMESQSEMGLFFCKDKNDLQYHFLNEDNRIILKAKTTIDDIIGCNGSDIQLKRVIPMSIEN